MRATWVLGAVAAAGLVTSIWLWRENRALEDELAARPAASSAATDPWNAPAAATSADEEPARSATARPIQPIRVGGGKMPALPDAPQESRLERRLRRRAELAAFLGRSDGETAEQYRARIVPLIKTALAKPRADVLDQRRELEAKAGVTSEQHAKLDAAVQDTYDDLLKYTNGAIADGELTPYTSNVAGMLQFAGGLGAILDGTQTKIGGILTPDQQRTFNDSGFEWGEYLGVLAPWEQLDPPPPPH